MQLNNDQLKAINGALNCEFIFSITGSAGTGKSTVIKQIYSKLKEDGKSCTVIAPTGRAANLLRDKIGDSCTIHKFLRYTTHDNGDTYKPSHNRFNMIEDYSYVIVDEASMVSREVADNLMSALPDKTRLILVGDKNQLPPIENTPQESFFNICLRKYPSVYLNERYRFGNQVALSELSDAVLEGSFKKIAQSGIAYRLDGVSDSRWLNKLASNEKYYTLDAQIISPVYRGVTGCEYINKLCQLHRFGDSKPIFNNMYSGDKVIAKINCDQFTNGDIMYLKDVTDNSIIFEEKTVDRWYNPCKGKVIDLAHCIMPAYCITTHKSQGGEYNDVVYIIGKSSIPVVNRANIYTGVTRSSSNLIVLYDYYTLITGLKKCE